MEKDTAKEYLMMREEILQYLGEYQAVRNMMYVVSAAILAINISTKISIYLYLLPLIVILPSYIIATDYWKCVVKASTYLRVFHESESDSIFHWESRHSELNKQYNFMSQKNYQHLPYTVCGSVCLVLYFLNLDLRQCNILELSSDKLYPLNFILGIAVGIICIIIFVRYRKIDEDDFMYEWQRIKVGEMEKEHRHKKNVSEEIVVNKNMSEYESIRSEIISMEEQQRNVWICMYTVYIALFAAGLELSYYLFLVTYVIIIPFQTVINRYKWYISKMSIYIRVFYESEDFRLRWEGMHVYRGYKEFYKKFDSNLAGVVRRTSAVHLGLLATIFFNIFVLCDNCYKNILESNWVEITKVVVVIVISWLLLFVTYMLNRNYNKNYDRELEKVIQEYKNSLL